MGTAYEIVVKGELGDTVAHAFEGMELDVRDGETAIVGNIADQAELAGILRRISDLGLTLVSVAAIRNGDSRSTVPTGHSG